jgi:chromosome segregation ATPase
VETEKCSALEEDLDSLRSTLEEKGEASEEQQRDYERRLVSLGHDLQAKEDELNMQIAKHTQLSEEANGVKTMLEEELSVTGEALAESEEQTASLQAELEAAQAAAKEETATLTSALESERSSVESLKSELATSTASETHLATELSTTKIQLADNREQLGEATGSLLEVEERLRELTETNGVQGEANVNLQASLAKQADDWSSAEALLRVELARLNDLNDASEVTLADSAAYIKELETEVADKLDTLEKVLGERDGLSLQLVDASMQVETLEAAQQAAVLVKTELGDAQKAIQKLRSDKSTLQADVKELTASGKKFEAKVQKYYDELSKAQQKGERLTQEVAHLEQKKERAIKNINQLITQRDEFENAKDTLVTALQEAEQTKAEMDTELKKREAEATKFKGRYQKVTASLTELKKVVAEQKVMVCKLENREELSKNQIGEKASEIESLTGLLRGLRRNATKEGTDNATITFNRRQSLGFGSIARKPSDN